MAGIRGEIRRESDDDGCGAEDIAVPIHDGSRWGGVDGDFDRFGLRAFDLGVGLGLRCGTAGKEQREKDGGGGSFHGSELMEELVTLSAHLRYLDEPGAKTKWFPKERRSISRHRVRASPDCL